MKKEQMKKQAAKQIKSVGRVAMSAAFNEWMRRFIEEPERFEREFVSVQKFTEGTYNYGQTCADHLIEIVVKLRASEKRTPVKKASKKTRAKR